MSTSADFTGFAVGAEVTGEGDWIASLDGVGTSGTSVSGAPTVAEDSTGKYLGPGEAIMADPDGSLAPATQITRVGVTVELPSVGALVRLVMPYSELLDGVDDSAGLGLEDEDFVQYVIVEAKRGSSGLELRAWLYDPFTGRTHWPLGVATSTTSAASGTLTVECGPSFIRAWWHTGRLNRRTAPDLGVYCPATDHLTWGLLTDGGRVRSVLVETDPTDGLEHLYRLEAEVDDPDSVEGEVFDSARVALATYVAHSQPHRRRALVGLGIYGAGSDGTLADTTFRRADPGQTLVLSPADATVSLGVWTLSDRLAGPGSELVSFVASDDPAGTDGGIGSGRATLDAGGEMAMEVKVVRRESVAGYAQSDMISETGGREVRVQIASLQRREWQIAATVIPEHVRRFERMLGASGGVRPIWIIPPGERCPVAVTIDGLNHSLARASRIDADYDAVEVV